MLADPAVVTINAVPHNLVRINQDGYSSEYLKRTATEEFRLNVRNSNRTDSKTGKIIDRHNAELIHTVFPVAPAVLNVVRKTYVVVENERGDTLTDPVADALGLLAYLSATSGANITKMLNSES